MYCPFINRNQLLCLRKDNKLMKQKQQKLLMKAEVIDSIMVQLHKQSVKARIFIILAEQQRIYELITILEVH